jgi:hypothetical protein
MAEHLDKLRGTLADLDAELDDVDQLDDDTRAMLADVAEEIAAVLRRGERTERTGDVEMSLRDRVVEFEASHPGLAGVMHRLIDGLSQLGI